MFHTVSSGGCTIKPKWQKEEIVTNWWQRCGATVTLSLWLECKSIKLLGNSGSWHRLKDLNLWYSLMLIVNFCPYENLHRVGCSSLIRNCQKLEAIQMPHLWIFKFSSTRFLTSHHYGRKKPHVISFILNLLSGFIDYHTVYPPLCKSVWLSNKNK